MTWIINYLIDRDIERLFWMLYRIDVSEKKVKSTLDYTGPDDAGRALAKLVLEREIKRPKQEHISKIHPSKTMKWMMRNVGKLPYFLINYI